MKLKKGDTVKVIAGKDKGQEGEIVHVFPSDNKVLVNGINTAKKHSKARKTTQQGGIIDRDMPVASRPASATRSKPTEPRFASPSAPVR
jgi:large subunit ribosomal protein L24